MLILCIPPINLLLDDDHTLQAGELKNVILETGMLVLPFFVLFLIHNFLLIPQLFLKKYYVRYMLAVIFTIGILFLYMPGWLEALHPQPPLHFLKSLRDDEMLKDLERQRLESELQYLKYQLNPHFFMNTLNNIYALVDLNTEQAKKTIIELSKLMRYVLYEANKNQISLEHEIQFLENYIALMKLRYIDNLNIRTEFPVVVPCVQIPPLLFISLLENAFKHGVSYQEPSFIEVRIELADEGVIFNCKNSKHTHAHKDAYHGIGIDNIKKRLHLLYGNNYTFTTNESENCFEVLLIIPFLS
ncbi:sensor histidine kinase [Phocaeicola coprophilus]|uniref:sensor histidine kinase n=1 Tax=Phocaeicola coprophilus TaxID=387090 RepID=UPI0029423DD8|nr:sensor histidine kinase [Phocaeicola coprophilus]